MNPADRNKILIAGGVALVAVIVIVFFVLRGRGGRQQVDTAGGFQDTAGETWEEGEGAAVPPGAEAPVAPGGEVAELPSAKVGVVQMGRGVDEGSRTDPFLTFVPKTPPPPPELVTPLPVIVLQPGGLRPAQPEGAAMIGRRRVAGVLFNERAWAILEEDEETFVVKPGDIVDGIQITAIAREAIYLVDPDGRRWEVPLRGTGPAAEMRPSDATYLGGMPELPPAAP